MASDMVGIALMALMVMLVIGGGTTWVYLAGQRDDPKAPTQGQTSRDAAPPSADHTVETSFATAGPTRHARRRELFLGP